MARVIDIKTREVIYDGEAAGQMEIPYAMAPEFGTPKFGMPRLPFLNRPKVEGKAFVRPDGHIEKHYPNEAGGFTVVLSPDGGLSVTGTATGNFNLNSILEDIFSDIR